MPKEKKTKFVILGFLLNDSLSGYEIGEMIKQSTNNFWQESDASIYPTLKLLTKEGLVSAEPAYVGKRKKEIFTLTDVGRKAFLEWFKRPPDQDLHREEFLLKLFFTDETTEEQMQQHCEEKLRGLKKLHDKYKKIEIFLIEQTPQKIYWLKTLRVGLAHLELDIALLT
ncbi:MAG: PadR family transcriptional regulator [Candidatus Protochlamydia sp.]|nr:PadR family transcriptional regulator [Candidatus Protochlamydia sp.]